MRAFPLVTELSRGLGKQPIKTFRVQHLRLPGFMVTISFSMLVITSNETLVSRC